MRAINWIVLHHSWSVDHPNTLDYWSIYDYHSSAREAGEAAEKAKVKILVLTHLIPDGAREQDFLNEAKTAFSGKIIVGRDLMSIQPPNASGK